MAAYVAENFGMSAALQQVDLSPDTRIEVLRNLTNSVRNGGDDGSFEALVNQLRPELIRLAGILRPNDPQELIGELYMAVINGAQTLPEIRNALTRGFYSEVRTDIRESRKRSELRLVVSPSAGTTTKNGQAQPINVPTSLPPGAISSVLRRLDPEDQYLWNARSEKVPFAEIAEELGCTEGAARERWNQLKKQLREFLSESC
jgi:DNA-directed RNA polymerase specialized sigma24 family protein